MIILTDNNHKFSEMCDMLKIAHFQAIQLPKNSLFQLTKKNGFALKEDTTLEPQPDGSYKHTSILSVFARKSFQGATLADGIYEKTYKAQVVGNLLSEPKTKDPGVFGWDDIFVVEGINLTYHELKQQGLKRSARSIVVNNFIEDIAGFNERQSLDWDDIDLPDVVYFDRKPYEIFTSNPYLSNPCFAKSDIYSIFCASVNDGVFFRSPSNKWQKNYWLPGLNAGIPLTPKSDPIHEATFMVHDVFHFAIPDLICDQFCEDSKRVYVCWRMMSEAITMVFADMIFVDSLVQSGYQYDWSKRKIYPVFKEIRSATLKDLLWANICFFLTGDQKPYRKLGVSQKTLNNFSEKYTPFAIEDLRWTEANFENIKAGQKIMERWIDIVGLNQLYSLQLRTVSSLKANLTGEKLLGYVFSKIWDLLSDKTDYVISPWIARRHAFIRYMAGQCILFAKFGFDQSYITTGKDLYKEVFTNLSIDGKSVDLYRKRFSDILDTMLARQFLTPMECRSYKNIVPMFDPFYVFYDSEKKPDLISLSQSIFGV